MQLGKGQIAAFFMRRNKPAWKGTNRRAYAAWKGENRSIMSEKGKPELLCSLKTERACSLKREIVSLRQPEKGKPETIARMWPGKGQTEALFMRRDKPRRLCSLKRENRSA